jgi:HAE1 family hydrophobic/amphiphilic exporter-1
VKELKNLASYSVNKAITIFMAVIIVVVFGVVSYTNLTTDLLPSLNIPYSVVVTYYPGASPTEVEELVTKPIEESLSTTTNVVEMNSTSSENVSLIILEFESDTNMDSAVFDMQQQLDMIASTLPDDAMDSMIMRLNPDMMPVMQLSVSKEGLSQQDLTTYVEEEVIPQIERVSGVASVSVSGAYESEVHVIIDETALELVNTNLTAAYTEMGVPVENQMTIDKEMISSVLQAQNFEFPVGYVNIDGVNYLVRVGDEFGSVEELSSLAILNFQGMPALDISPIMITLDDIADVTYVNSNMQEYSKVNGNNAISITVQKNSEVATTDVTNEINAIIADFEDSSDTDFTVLLDQGEYIEQATGSVSDNLLIGAALAVIVLLVFLKSARATFIVGVSIPISLLFAIVLIYFSNITLNIVSLGGLALGIGMLVDNSIVVMENIFRLKKNGKSNKEAAIEGTKQVAGAIAASTLTTISVFVPIIFIEGFIKEIFMQMALTIAYSLTASLVIALTLVPAISSKILKEDNDEKPGKMFETVKGGYEKIFNAAFKVKYILMLVVILLFGSSIVFALNNGFEYFPASDEGQLSVTIENPVDNPLSFEDFTAVLDDFSDDIEALEDVDTIGITLGSMTGMFFGGGGSNSATASVILKTDRNLSTGEVEILINNILAEDYTTIEYDVTGAQQQTSMLTGSGLQVELIGYDLDVLQAEATKIANIMEDVDGVVEVDNGIGILADEMKVTVDKETAIQYGITTAQVLGVISGYLATEEVVTTINESGNLYDVYVIDSSSNTENAAYDIEDIENLVVGMDSMTSTPILVQNVATVEFQKGLSSISHVNGDRSITVNATFDESINASFIAQDIEDALADYTAPDGYTYTIQGENEEIMEAFNTLGLAVILAIVLIYMVMASQFQSLTYPFIIMFTIPLAFTGGFYILFFAGMPVSVVSLIGFIILVGVVVNNGIVLVDYTNQLREEGYGVKEALLEAGKTRMRPIIMTALTTILALSTMALGFGQGAEMMQPMAVTTVGGLLYATVLTLFIVPIMYYLLTKYAKNVMLGLLTFTIVIATVGLYVFFSLWYIILAGAIIIAAIIALWVITGFRSSEVHE